MSKLKFLGLFFLFAALGSDALAADCYKLLTELQFARFARAQLGDSSPVILYADGTKIPIARAFEKEGLLYSDIAEWFPSAKATAADKMRARLKAEQAGEKNPRNLLRWLKRYSDKYRATGVKMPQRQWNSYSPEAQLDFILSEPDFFRLVNVKGREDLFYDGVLNFDDLAVTDKTPRQLTVGDDLGSYEVRSDGGTVDRNKYLDQRDVVENFLEGKVGHQHKVHAWPENAGKRAMMAPKYIEMLDAGTWYLFWRQMKRNPSDVESILSHPYLGVYTRWWLNRLYTAVVEANPRNFKNKFRMMGARNFKVDPNIPEQAASPGGVVPDIELRSGNKTDNRDFVEDMMEARIASGDYSGLRDFRDYDFDPSAPMEALSYRWLNESEIELLKRFEGSFPLMKYSRQANAHNHFRTKIIAPLLPWASRLDIPYKRPLLEHEQELYAKRLAGIAEAYLKARRKLENRRGQVTDREALQELNEETLDRLEKSAYRFSDNTRLDLDFERYLTPRPGLLPLINVKSTGPIDVNAIALGIEYSFRFPSELPITSKEIAEAQIQRTIDAIRTRLGGGEVEKLDDGGHGHGASVRYRYTDPEGRVWRAEWDGIQRSYIDGRLIDPHGGHVEVPSPKFYPDNIRADIQPIFDAARSAGQIPKRAAGGGHMNTDLAVIKEIPGKEGPQKIKSLIGYFESVHDIMTFLWQHPHRAHAARAVELKPGFAERLAAFDGDWNDLARFLYHEQYFNPYVTRKPRYVEMDLTGLMQPVVPNEYRQGTLDIKNPTQEWFPDFGTGKDRVEFRLYDAPTDELMAALQIKYHRAFLNKAWNSPQPIALRPLYEPGIKEIWRKDAKRFFADAEAHLRDLGLDPDEFRPLVQQAWEMQQEEPSPPKDLQRYENWLPPRDPGTPGAMLWTPPARLAA